MADKAIKLNITVHTDAAKIVIDDEHTITITRYPTHTILCTNDWTGKPALVWLSHADGEAQMEQQEEKMLRWIRGRMKEKGFVDLDELDKARRGIADESE